jgi:integrase/recombinase XerC
MRPKRPATVVTGHVDAFASGAHRAPSERNADSKLVEQFLDELARQRRLSPHTILAYRRDLKDLFDLTAEPLTQLHSADIRRALARLHGQGAAPASLARTLSAWRRFFTWLAAQGATHSNPAAGVRAPRRAKLLPKALAPDQAVQLAAHQPAATQVGLRDKAMVELLYSSGLRVSELVGLDWRHFAGDTAQRSGSGSWLDLDGCQVTVRGKGGKQRQVPVGAPAIEALRAWLRARALIPGADTRALFLSSQGKRLSVRSVQVRLAQLAQRLGLGVRVHPHVLRHSMASHVLQSSGDLRAVQELLGHSSLATTQVYTRLDWQHLAQSYDAAHPRARRKSG